jgi:PAS domain S-box-containing protein
MSRDAYPASLFADHYQTPAVPTTIPPGECSPEPTSAVLFRRQQAVVAMGRRAAAQPELSLLTQDAAHLMAEMLEVDYGAVAECVPGTDSLVLRFIQRDGDPQDTVPSIQLPNTPTGSLAAFTLHGRQLVLVDDLHLEQRFDDPALRRLQIRSAMSIPLALRERGFGVLAALTTTPRDFHPQDVCFGENVAHLLTTAMACKQSEDLLASQRRMADAVLEVVDALVLELAPEGHIRTINRAGVASTGFSMEDLRQRPLWSVFCRPDEADAWQNVLRRLKTQNGPLQCQTSLTTKHGAKRRIAWTCGAVRDSLGHLQSVIATGIDVSDRIDANLAASSPSDKPPPDPSSAGQTNAAEESPPATSDRDRRTQPRKLYPYQQRIAPVLGRRLPSRSDFIPVTCHDISPGGFSFVSQTPPESDQYVVALGRGRSLTYVIAQVAHMRRLEQDDERRYLIGCNYVGRADY